MAQTFEYDVFLSHSSKAQVFGSNWAQLEADTFRFRDPLNKERRFIPVCLDDAPIKGSLAQFLYFNWIPKYPEQRCKHLGGFEHRNKFNQFLSFTNSATMMKPRP